MFNKPRYAPILFDMGYKVPVVSECFNCHTLTDARESLNINWGRTDKNDAVGIVFDRKQGFIVDRIYFKAEEKKPDPVEKVYCKNCTYCFVEDLTKTWCKIPATIKVNENWYQPAGEIDGVKINECYCKNNKNNCKDFKWKTS